MVFVWGYFRLPEMKGRTYEELDILFANRVPARQFATTHVDAYAAVTSEVQVASKPAVTEIHEVSVKE